jgi:hypothetical protein
MKRYSKASLVLALGIAVAFGYASATAQTTPDAAASNAAKAAKDKKAADFAASEKAMQDASRSSASGAVGSPVTEAKPYNKNNKEAGKAAMGEALDVQTFKGSKPVDKNAKAQAPMKSISKMTPEERAQLRKEVVEGAKP